MNLTKQKLKQIILEELNEAPSEWAQMRTRTKHHRPPPAGAEKQYRQMVDQIATGMASMNLMTGEKGGRKMRPEWEAMITALQKNAKAQGHTPTPTDIFFPKYKQNQKDKKAGRQQPRVVKQSELDFEMRTWRLVGKLNEFIWNNKLPETDLISDELANQYTDAYVQMQTPKGGMDPEQRHAARVSSHQKASSGYGAGVGGGRAASGFGSMYGSAGPGTLATTVKEAKKKK